MSADTSRSLQEAFSRWSRRKAESRAASTEQGSTARVEQVSGVAVGPRPDLAAVEELNEASDFTCFLGDEVDGAVHVAAFRRLWLSHPRYGASDDLDIYRADYRSLALDVVADATPSQGSEPVDKKTIDRV